MVQTVIWVFLLSYFFFQSMLCQGEMTLKEFYSGLIQAQVWAVGPLLHWHFLLN